MPGITVGAYTGQLDAGTEVSSTYEGRHITVTEEELIHPYRTGGFVNKGDPVIVCDAGVPGTYGNLVGVAFKTATATSDFIAVDTEGIWNLKVDAYNDLGGSAIEIGDPLYIRAGTLLGTTSVLGTGDAEISKINDSATQVFFGYALGSMESTGSGRIAVKVHAAPWPEQEERRWHTVATGAYGDHSTAVFAGGTSEGLFYRDQRITGVQTGNIYGWSTWMELAVAFTPTDNLLVAQEIGIYDVGCGLAANGRVVMQQMQAILAETPATSFHWFRINLAAAGGSATAIFAAANPTSVAYHAAITEADTPVGYVPLFDIVGHGVRYVRLYADYD